MLIDVEQFQLLLAECVAVAHFSNTYQEKVTLRYRNGAGRNLSPLQGSGRAPVAHAHAQRIACAPTQAYTL
jgi:hypothetical protein